MNVPNIQQQQQQVQKVWIPMLFSNGFAILCLIIGILTPKFSFISIFCAWTVWIVQLGSYIYVSYIGLGLRAELSHANRLLLIGWLFISPMLQIGIYLQKFLLSTAYQNSWNNIPSNLISWWICQGCLLLLPIFVSHRWKYQSENIKEIPTIPANTVDATNATNTANTSNSTNPTNPSNPSNPSNPTNPSNPADAISTRFLKLKLMGLRYIQISGLILLVAGIIFAGLLLIHVEGDFWGYLGIMGLNFPIIIPVIILPAVLLTIPAIQEANIRRKKSRIGKTQKILVPTVAILLIILLIPLFSIPINIQSAKEAFPSEWNTEDPSFLTNPYSFSTQLLGQSVPDCQVQEDILFFNGSESSYLQDRNLSLHFDVYSPLPTTENLPGKNATIIRIHGGYWVQGDTKMMVQQCRYFASQGYIVFDIQYGLHNSTSNIPFDIKGNFTHDDMIRHVGNFTHYLADHALEYGADINRTIVFGASAGTTLAMAIVYGQEDPRISAWISQEIIFKGLYLFYPASGYQENRDVVGTADFLTPEVLIQADSPPCLIFAGTHDQLINPDVSQGIKSEYEKFGDENCCIIWLKFYPHAFAWNEYNSGSQIALYYTERFLKAVSITT